MKVSENKRDGTYDNEVDLVEIVSGGLINKLSSPFDEVEAVRKGFPVNRIKRLESIMRWDRKAFAKFIRTTPKTLERYARDNKHLSPQVSENTLDVARLMNLGIAYFESVERWNLWLNTPHVQFNNSAPVSVLDSASGRALIKRIVLGLEYGFVA
ncbi:antitoxin Xre/MbcA/ParS toxin-binding domain-containing protein [Alteromonas macleodii]|uniref:Antitoxin Xre/MbcA/ParS-like toxin-binding domain-containing protein n=1 Tax=Alteromonas macleodii TaxID=28108 RepID=A0A6T9Y815_ALTMA|nr:antitoxin Xre/MbcA/ParS toxin-binding domain-containing protein [Alteromonas macleodii]CAB9495480.1 conserved protein of unknown function [Alteromonas macleodii]